MLYVNDKYISFDAFVLGFFKKQIISNIKFNQSKLQMQIMVVVCLNINLLANNAQV